MDVSKPKGNEAGNDAANGVARKPNAYSRRHFVSSVPRRREKHKGRGNGRFCHAQEESHGHEAPKVGACCCQRHDSPPYKSVEGEILGSGQAGDEHGGWILPYEVAKVEYTADPAVLLPYKMLHISEPTDSRLHAIIALGGCVKFLTVSSRKPNTAALDKMTLSIKLSM